MNKHVENKKNKDQAKSMSLLRERLLDLSGRNKLLNFQHSKTHIRVIDEVSDQLYDKLLDSEELTFLPVPQPTSKELKQHGYIKTDTRTGEEILVDHPTATEWAKILGFDTDYELPGPSENAESKHKDTGIQTLFFLEELEARLRNIYNKAKSFEEESGTSILYLVFGFLEWYESTNSTKSRLAPLYLVPVRLEREKLDKKTNTFVYTVSYSDEDLIPNLSLREKLKNDFGVHLPEIKEESDNTEEENKPGVKPEEYFSFINEIIKKTHPRWKVHRYCTLGMLYFGKLLLYLDLNPKKWPLDCNIEEHEVVSALLGTDNKTNSEPNNFSNEYNIDTLENIHYEYPLIDDADSSQHSVLIDALNGKNLVVEGPPGTGKSQTISNLIAAAIAKGKTVLFVTEKLVALEVVKRRLDKAGLGDFCLELHSHKTRKSHVLNDINQRIQNQSTYGKPDEIEAEIKNYEKYKKELGKYAYEISLKWKHTGKKAYEILTAIVRFRAALEGFDTKRLESHDLNSELIDKDYIKKLGEFVFEFKQAYEKIINHMTEGANLNDHSWFGIQNTGIQIYDIEKVTDLISELQESIGLLNGGFHQLEEIIPSLSKIKCNRSIEYIENTISDLKKIPETPYDIKSKKIVLLKSDELVSLRTYLDLHTSIQTIYHKLEDSRNIDLKNGSLPKSDLLNDLINEANNLPINTNVDCNGLKDLIYYSDNTIKLTDKIKPVISSTGNAIGIQNQYLVTMSEDGLSNLKTLIHVLNKIDVSLLSKRNPCFDKTNITECINYLAPLIKSINDSKKHLVEIYDLSLLPNYRDIKQMQHEISNHWVIGMFKKSWWASRKSLKLLSKYSKTKYQDLTNNLPSLCDYAKTIHELNNTPSKTQPLNELYDGINTDVDSITKLRDWYKSIKEDCSFSTNQDKTPLALVVKSIPETVAVDIRSMQDNGIYACITEILNNIESIRDNLLESKIDNCNLLQASDDLNVHNLSQSLKKIIDFYNKHFISESLNFEALNELLADMLSLNDKITEFSNLDIQRLVPTGNNQVTTGIDCDNTNKEILELIYNQSANVEQIKSYEIRNYIYQNSEYPNINVLNKLVNDIEENLNCLTTTLDQYIKVGQIQDDVWAPNWEQDISILRERNTKALHNKDQLIHWIDYINTQSILEKAGLGNLVECVEDGTIPINKAFDGIYFIIYDVLSRDLYSNNPDLKRYFTKDLATLRSLFQKCDSKLKSLQRKHIASIVSENHIPHGTTGRLAKDFTEMCLLERECAKQKRHIPIRKLVQRANGALLGLKPCFMMGPLAVAQYLPPRLVQFDLVIMDEASQIKPEDAVGVVARGKQSVIIGDSKQLPPTNFFSNMMEESDDEDKKILLTESESILDAAMPIFNKRRLRWHYRSQHESLIAFSNSNFYHSNLVIFPSPHHKSDSYGIKIEYIQNAKFSDNVNQDEAKAIVTAVTKHLLNHPDESLGIVAMNLPQANLIDFLIEKERKNDRLLEGAFEAKTIENEPLFIKNLENVQGDERDVIFISTTYGPCEYGGKVYQRFGPINSDSGWRRLNVLFTRSKKRMHIFTSLKPEDIVVSNSSRRGVKSLRDFLAYAHTGILDQAASTGEGPDSDFEVAVANQLRDAGFDVEYQVGVAGFYIDIAVKHPTKPGVYMMGIESDGATYHSAKSTRDSDRLRQEILESKGWKIRRIWSTDWFKDYKSTIRPIINELKKLTGR